MSQATSSWTAALSGPISKGDLKANVRAFVVARRAIEDHPAFPARGRVYTPLAFPKTKEAAAESRALLVAGEDYRRGPLYQQAVRWYFQRVLLADTLFMLSGWERSHGARSEAWLAQQSGIQVLLWHPDPDRREPVDVGLRLMSAEEVDKMHSDGFRQGIGVSAL